MHRLKIFLASLWIVIVALHCGYDRAKANEKRAEGCLSLVWKERNRKSNSTLTTEEKGILENPSIEFAYSCSSVDGRSPSCKEFYSVEPEAKFLTEFCLDEFRKFRAKCSEQNQIGECLIFRFEENRWERRIYARPNDDFLRSQADCLAASGRFFEPESLSLPLSLLVACSLDGNESDGILIK